MTSKPGRSPVPVRTRSSQARGTCFQDPQWPAVGAASSRNAERTVRRLPSFAMASAMLLAVAVSACGGSSVSSNIASATTTVAGRTSTKTATFTQCLTSHGVPGSAISDLLAARQASRDEGATPAGVPSGSTPTIPSLYQSAVDACKGLITKKGSGSGGGNSAQKAAYRNCLTLHGVTPPTSPSTTPGQTSRSPGSKDAGLGIIASSTDPTAVAARHACANLLPGQPGPATTTPGP